MEKIKQNRFKIIISIITKLIDSKYINEAENSLNKLLYLNKNYGNEYNDQLVKILEKDALCLK